jgi:dTDP-4-dehydrorhamnose reductase
MDIARAMFLLLKDNKKGIYHIGSTDYMNRVELAKTVLKYFPDATYEMIATDTPSLQQPAPRPLLGGFIHSKFSQEYPGFLFSTVDDYLRSKIADIAT